MTRTRLQGSLLRPRKRPQVAKCPRRVTKILTKESHSGIDDKQFLAKEAAVDIDAKKLPRVALRSNIDDTHFVTKDKESVKDDTQILLRVYFFFCIDNKIFISLPFSHTPS